MTHFNPTRLERALCALEGLSVGDAFGDRFFIDPDLAATLIAERALPAPPWAWTDDTLMALSLVAVLRQHGAVDQDALARSFAARYSPGRKYGPAMHRLLAAIDEGGDWRALAPSQFEGQGSYGNGAAMRVAPLDAYFADDLDAVVEQATRSAEVTHSHPEASAGAIAVAVAAALAWRQRESQLLPGRRDFLDLVLSHVPPGEVRSGIARARDLAPGDEPEWAARMLGSGVRISAQDTVPFALWCAGESLGRYEEALWLTARGLGDVDTTCAIVGGIVAMATGLEGIPASWREDREPLPDWHLRDAGDEEVVTLYRPVGPDELALIRASGDRAFPPRLPEQPIFYPVLNQGYAAEIAREWNARSPEARYQGYVTRFAVRASFLRRYEVQVVGKAHHQEYWIPAEDLDALNASIVGPIEVVEAFGAEA